MALVISDEVQQSLKEAQATWNKLLLLGPLNKANWTDEQKEALALMAELMKHNHNTIQRLIRANS